LTTKGTKYDEVNLRTVLIGEKEINKAQTKENQNMRKTFLLIFVYLIIGKQAESQIKWDESFTSHISLLNSTNPDNTDNSDFVLIDSLIANKRIIALGEATHGTKEFFTTKHRLIKYLVENHGFRVFTIEDDFTLSHNINDFVLGQIETKPEKLLSANWIGAWRTQEVLDLLLWLKSYNKNKADNDRVKIYGCDMHYRPAADYILNNLNQGNQLNAESDKTLRFLIDYRRSVKMTKQQKNDLKQLVSQLRIVGNDTSDERLAFTIETLIQSVDLLNRGVVSGTIARDRYMAENCKRIYESENKKMIVWAHNQHVAEKSDVSKKKPMGSHLKGYWGDDYYTIGFGFYEGEYLAYNPEKRKICPCKAGIPQSDCVDHLFAKAPFENFMLNLNNEKLPTELNRLINKTTNTRRAGSFYHKDVNARTNYRKSILSKSYDMLVFIRNSRATTILPYTP